MNTVATVLFTIATELAKQAKDSLPKMQDGEKIRREWYEDGIYYRETTFNGKVFQSQYDFRKRKSSQITIESR